MREAIQALSLVTIAVAALGVTIRPPAAEAPMVARRGLAAWAERARHWGDEETDGASCDQSSLDRGLVMPKGEPTSLACDDARTVVQQARTSLAAPVAPIDAAKFAAATNDWLDPHGLWSVAPDAPAGALVRRNGDRLLAELEAPPNAGPCNAARAIGTEMVAWADELRALFDQGEREGRSRPPAERREAWKLAAATPFEDGTVTRGARDLARELGRTIGELRAAYGDAIAPFAEAARNRAAPKLDADGWARVITAASLRAYVPQLDAHGAWAPMDEELSIYDLGLEADPPARLWSDRVRTPLGVRIEKGAMPPLADGDVVLKIGETALAGMSVEQVEQLSVISDARPGTPTRVTVLRQGAAAPLELAVLTPRAESGEGTVSAPSELPFDYVRYGEGRAALVAIADVPDDLGTRLGAALERAREAHDLRGLVLDLRANGGGSTDGAIGAIGLFLPGATLFPMRRRDGGLEVERAPDVAADKRYDGPLAVLVDGDSASAAEMIAGGLLAYRRAVVIGDRTYGKGCAQEYLDDDAHTGVLRLTTLLFALPDGSPLQKTGILPNVQLSLPATTEREAALTRALGPWRGPDVRDPGRVKDVPWPNHGGRIGPCKDATVCRALRALGSTRAAAR